MARTREAILYRDSKDPKVAETGSETRTGKKWKASHELTTEEQILTEGANRNSGSGQIRPTLLS